MKDQSDVKSVIAELQEALARVGIVLPSLGLDPVSYAHSAMRPLVELGRCNMDTARRLTEALGER
ncbi:hypothetical protein [Streptomyces sp. NPDC057579]|uniref:hypothetical protein n=1 Tax=Streptomyces sp. NPDC057579 TaxID=3346172 RepID=UPI0036A0B94C